MTELLSHKRLALVGASHDERDFSRMVMRALLERGYDVVPVNPKGGVMEGREAVPDVGSIDTMDAPVAWALIMTPPAASAGVVRACWEAGIPRVWLHRGAGAGAVSEEAIAACEELGLRAVVGECPMMFLADTEFVHRVHAFAKKLAGSYPARA